MSVDSLESCTPVFPGSVGRWPSSVEAAALKSIHKIIIKTTIHICDVANIMIQ